MTKRLWAKMVWCENVRLSTWLTLLQYWIVLGFKNLHMDSSGRSLVHAWTTNHFHRDETAINIHVVYWWNAETTITHQDLWLGEIVPSSHQRSELSNTILCIISRWDQRIGECIPIPGSLGEEADYTCFYTYQRNRNRIVPGTVWLC